MALKLLLESETESHSKCSFTEDYHPGEPSLLVSLLLTQARLLIELLSQVFGVQVYSPHVIFGATTHTEKQAWLSRYLSRVSLPTLFFCEISFSLAGLQELMLVSLPHCTLRGFKHLAPPCITEEILKLSLHNRGTVIS